MTCYNHHDRQSVGICKACGRAVCPDCIVEVGESIACKGRCEDQIRLIDTMIRDNIRNMPYVNRVVQSSQSSKFVLPVLLLGSGLLCCVWAIYDYRQSGKIGLLFTTGIILMIYGLPRLISAIHVSRTQPYPAGHCRRCGYNLRGNTSGQCPECGRKS